MNRRLVLSLPLLAVLAACTVTRVEVAPTVAAPEQFRYAAAAGAQQDIARWWRHWHNPELNALIEQGLGGNFTLAAARERMRSAQAFAAAARADVLPQAGISANIGRQRVEADNPLAGLPQLAAMGGQMPSEMKMTDSHRLAALSASWEIDLFGKKTSDADAVAAQALSAQEMFHAAQTAVAAQIADTYFLIATLDAQSKVLQESITAVQELERYAQGRFRAGQATQNDVRNSSARLTQLRAKVEPLRAQRAQAEQQLAVLLGVSPQTFRLPENPQALATLPAPPVGIAPSELIERRPDVRARAAAVQTAAAKLASARADLLPRFYLNFMLQDGRIGIGSAPDLNATASLVSLGVQLPIFTAGRIRANIRAQDASLQAALADYDHTLLTALQETDSAYALRTALDKHLTTLGAAQRVLQQRAADSRRFYENGYHAYQDVLQAQLDALQYRDDVIVARQQTARATIALYRALGGGWLPETEDTQQ
ncbi:MAG: TolC family protein [Neisseria sp.]|nr:TolC family protein [Neisseria sp.]